MPQAENPQISFSEAVSVWARIGLLSFGGPAGQIALMHRMIVEERGWVEESRFLNALNFCMLLPGPEAQQLAIYLGWLMHRTAGGIVAGVLFILPGFFAILALSCVYVALGTVPIVEGLFFGLKAAVLAIIVQALLRIGSRALPDTATRLLALFAFVALAIFSTPFPLVILVAGHIGYFGTRAGLVPSAAGFESATAPLPSYGQPSRRWSGAIVATFAGLWLLPTAALLVWLGPGNIFSQIALFFSQMAVVTFGGAYAVLAYVAQEAVQHYGWLAPGEMLDGLGMAETTPGPLIQVLQFVAFMGAFRDPGLLNPYAAATLAALLATWVTFTPSFLWIFLGAPHIERLHSNRALAGALSASLPASRSGSAFIHCLMGKLLSLYLGAASKHRICQASTPSRLASRF